jgi:RHS repeat-associated protein
VTTYDYNPWGSLLSGTAPRKSFIDKERDKESGLSNFGVREYTDDADGGRFLRPDRLWEKFPDETPYNYADNNPVLKKDPNGDCPICPFIPAIVQAVYALGVATISWIIVSKTSDALQHVNSEPVPQDEPAHKPESGALDSRHQEKIKPKVEEKVRSKPGELGQRKSAQAKDAENKVVKDIAKKLGLDKSEQRNLHDNISDLQKINGSKMTYNEILEEASRMFGK